MIGNINIIRQFISKINSTNKSEETLENIWSFIKDNEQEFRNELYRCNSNKQSRNLSLEDLIRDFKWDIDIYNYINLRFVKSAKIRNEYPIITKIMGWGKYKFVNPLE